ncbi:hypothetical protein KQI84_05060 [bacterium]|nr:hypothetical protein [bacterium]
MKDTSSETRQTWGLFALLLVAGLLVFAGQLGSSDELLMAMTTRSIVFDLSLRFPETYGQTFTGYGLGMPLAGIPAFLLEFLIRKAGLLSTTDVSLLPLTNVVLFALTGVLAAGIVRRLYPDKQKCLSTCIAISFIASPLLPASQTFYSEVPSAFGLVGMAWALLQPADSGPWRKWIAPVFFPAVAMLARVAMLPSLLLVLAWGWVACPDKKRLVLAGAGIAIGIAGRLAQNAVLRGSPFDQGYSGQEFVTPLFTGIHGLILSPERGLLLFYPVLLWALFPFRSSNSATRAFERLAIAVLLFAVVFHASFWTWHGGWTSGPRFLLPSVALGTPLVAILLSRIAEFRPRLRLLLVLVAGWGLLAAILYSAFSAIDVWNEMWGFHQVESRWLFEPQLSLWHHWTSLAAAGEFQPVWLRAFMGILPDGYPSFLPLRFISVATILLAICALLWVRRRFPATNRWALATGGVVLLLGGAIALSGPRGWQTADSPDAPERFPVMRLDGPAQGGEFVTYVNLRPHGKYTLAVKSNGLYDVQLDDETLLQQTTPGPQHMRVAPVEIDESGLRELRVAVSPQPGEPLLFRMYWTWPGEGRVLDPLGGRYTQPRTFSGLESFAYSIARRAHLLFAAWLALVLLLWPVGEVKRP